MNTPPLSVLESAQRLTLATVYEWGPVVWLAFAEVRPAQEPYCNPPPPPIWYCQITVVLAKIIPNVSILFSKC
jgi:hypothetical protein